MFGRLWKKQRAEMRREPEETTAVEPEVSSTVLQNHRFPPGTEVGIYTMGVGIERSLGREPIPDPLVTATVGEDGTLVVDGLVPGSWIAAGPVGDRHLYLQFMVPDEEASK